MANMIVAGHVTPTINGVYVEDGTENSKPKYINSNNGYRIAWFYDDVDETQWTIVIGYTKTAMIAASSTGDVATPNLALWDGSVTVTEEQSGTTHDGEVALSSLSYLRTKKA